MRKGKTKLGVVILLIIIFAGLATYKFIYKSHRDIAGEDAQFTLSAKALLQEFVANDSLANAKYADKTIVVSGEVSDFDAESHAVVVDGVLSATFKDSAEVATAGPITLKGRFVGYDDLLGELKMDQVSQTKK